MMKVRALIFDFDGLILNTERAVFQSWQELYRSFGQELPLSEWVKIVGTNDTSSFSPQANLERLVGGVDWASIAPRRKSREAELVRGEQVLPGVETILEDGKRLGLKIGLASSSGRAWVLGHLSRLGLAAYFDCIKTREDVERTKPDPELFLQALSCLGVEAEQAVVFEDSPNGIRSAKAAGIFTVGAPTEITRAFVDGLADLQLGSLAEMPLEEILRRAEGGGKITG